MDTVFKKIARIRHQDIPTVAAAGVERAVAARNVKLRVLSEEELCQVGGGAAQFAMELINGGRMELMKATSMKANVMTPAIDAGTFAGMPTLGVMGL